MLSLTVTVLEFSYLVELEPLKQCAADIPWLGKFYLNS